MDQEDTQLDQGVSQADPEVLVVQVAQVNLTCFILQSYYTNIVDLLLFSIINYS